MIKVRNEIKPLKKVLLHRPSNELKVLNENNKEKYLFDELPNIEEAIKEHDNFANILKKEGVEVLYLEDLMAKVLKENDIKEEFIKEYLEIQNSNDEKIYQELLSIKDEKELVLETMSGLNGKLDSIPNLYFTRDTFTIIGSGIALYHMHTNVRNREVIYGKYINKYYFKLPIYYKQEYEGMIEGGDVMLLDDKTFIIGQSERTTFDAAYKLATNVLKNDKQYENVLLMEIPSKRACMHLDTVFTRFDDNKFVIFDEIYQTLKLKIINKNGVNEINDDLKTTLNKLLNREDVKIITCGNNENKFIEQWNDACNTLCISPNKFIVYDINETTNEKFEKEGATLFKLPSKELLKGRGGAHCMSMPLLRE